MERRQLEQAAVALLRHHEFAGANARAVADLLERGTAFRQPGGTVLYREGERADALFFLLEGRLQPAPVQVSGLVQGPCSRRRAVGSCPAVKCVTRAM